MEKKVCQELSSVKIKGEKIPLIFEKNSILPIISMQIIIQVAGKIENKNYAGLSHLCAKIFSEGTEKLNATKFATKLEDRAINLDIHNGKETFIFSLQSLKTEFAYGVSMLAKLLDKPNITEKSLQKVKSNILGKISDKNSDFDFIANNKLQELLYANSPLQNPNIGTNDSIKKIQLQDVENFISSHIDISNAIIVIGGDLKMEEAKKYAQEVLSQLPKGEKRNLPYIETSNKKQYEIIVQPTEQAYIYFGSPFYMKNNDENLHKSKVAGFILGASGFGSRLMEEIRVKRGLAYSAYGKMEINSSHSNFNGYLQTKNDNKNEAIEVVKNVVNEFVQTGVTQEELDQAKRFILGSEPLRNEKLSQRLALSFGEIYQGFYLGHQKDQLKKIQELRYEDLNEFIKEHKEICELSFAVVTNEK